GLTTTNPDILGIGITGRTLTDLERSIISETSPYAVVLFGRNIESDEQLRELVSECKRIAKRPPLMMIDEEGGRVDRLRNLVPGLPSAQAFDEGEQPLEMSEWTGKVIGMALRYFDIEIDLAPVAQLGEEAGAIMIGHGTYPQIDDPDLPATLSRRISGDLLRNDAGFQGFAITDDMEMHAVSDLGAYEELTDRALIAGNDVI